MERRITLLVPRRASSQIIKPDGRPGYFHSLYVNPNYRQRGYGLELMKFAIQHLQEFVEMDILNRSKACQRSAEKIGYCNTGLSSERYFGCDLWRYCGTISQFPVSRWRISSAVHYKRASGKTEVIYLRS